MPGGGVLGGAAAGAGAGSWAGPVGAIGGALIGAAGSLFSGKQSADYAERSYKHRYQWMVKDLQKAGLNPMLAVGQSPGQPPQPQFQNIGEGAIKGGSAAYLARAQVENLQASTEASRASANKTMAEAEAQGYTNAILKASPEYLSSLAAVDSKTGAVSQSSAIANERVQAELKTVTANAQRAATEADTAKIVRDIRAGELTAQQIQLKYAEQLATIETAYREAMKRAAEANLPREEADAAFWEGLGPVGKALMYIKQFMPGGK